MDFSELDRRLATDNPDVVVATSTDHDGPTRYQVACQVEASAEHAEWPVHYVAAFHLVASVAAAAGQRSGRAPVAVAA